MSDCDTVLILEEASYINLPDEVFYYIKKLEQEKREFKRLAKEYYKFMEIQGYEAQHQDILDFRCEVKNGS